MMACVKEEKMTKSPILPGQVLAVCSSVLGFKNKVVSGPVTNTQITSMDVVGKKGSKGNI